MRQLSTIKPIYKIGGAFFLIVAILIVSVKIFSPSDEKWAVVERGEFVVEIQAMGEVQAMKSQNITVPDLMLKEKLRINHLKITDLVAEGTEVQKGDYVASLDNADVEERIKKIEEKLESLSHGYENAKLDSTLTLSESRDAIVNAKDAVLEKEIVMQQSQFESKAVQRQARIAYDQAKRVLEQKERNYKKLKYKSSIVIQRYENDIAENSEINDLLQQLKNQLKIKSPSGGLVVYAQSYRRRKIKVNDYAGPWAPIIASIPDLSSVVSEAMVKEIDISKVKVGQKVRLSIDAFPGREYQGQIKSIANIGQPLQGTGMNGFKTIIEFDRVGDKILPSMTTVNKIQTSFFENVLQVPREALFVFNGKSFLYTKDGISIVRKSIKVEYENETHIQISDDVEEGQFVLLVEPKDTTGMSWLN